MREVRFLTILAITIVSLWTLWRGALAVDYEFVAGQPILLGDPARTFGPWQNERGVASLAIENKMRVAPDPGDAKQIETRRAVLADYLGVVPLSSQRWLDLAVMRHASGLSPEKIIEALALSSLTGPNEAAVILNRSAFALSIWEKLDAKTRDRTIGDLAVITPPLDAAGIRLALSIQTPKIRADLRDTLAARGMSVQSIRYIGL
jgi:hypothetical protein